MHPPPAPEVAIEIIEPDYFELTQAFYLRAKQGFTWTTVQQDEEADTIPLNGISASEQRRSSTFVTIPRIFLSDLWRQAQSFYSSAIEAGEQVRLQNELGIENLDELKCEAQNSLIKAAQDLFQYYQDLGGLHTTPSNAAVAFHTLTQIKECLSAAGLDTNIDSTYREIFVTTKIVDGEPVESKLSKEEFDLAFTMVIPELPAHRRTPF